MTVEPLGVPTTSEVEFKLQFYHSPWAMCLNFSLEPSQQIIHDQV